MIDDLSNSPLRSLRIDIKSPPTHIVFACGSQITLKAVAQEGTWLHDTALGAEHRVLGRRSHSSSSGLDMPRLCPARAQAKSLGFAECVANARHTTPGSKTTNVLL